MQRVTWCFVLSAVLGAASLTGAAAQGTPTKVMVRVIAHDAKLIGSSVAGARITIVSVATGDTLAAGIQTGNTGNTQAIMVSARERGKPIFDTPDAAGYLAHLDVTAPTLVEIRAEGPLGFPQAVQRASATTWVVPGQDVLGDGIVLELFGFTVELVEPTERTSVSQNVDFEIRARVTMLCGCPTEPGGLWNADAIAVLARLTLDGRPLREIPLRYAGTTSTYTALTSVSQTGVLEIQVIAMDPAKANVGIARESLTIQH